MSIKIDDARCDNFCFQNFYSNLSFTDNTEKRTMRTLRYVLQFNVRNSIEHGL